jgi:hypothetical protein
MSRRSRKITWLTVTVLLILALQAGYAWYRGYVAQQLGLNVNNWILARTAEGYSIDADFARESGNWLTVSQTLDNIIIAAPRDDWDLKVASLSINVDTTNPFKVTFVPAPALELRYTVADDEYRMTGAIRRGNLGFTYGTDGQARSVFIQDFSGKLSGPMELDIGFLQADAQIDPAPSATDGGESVGLIVGLHDLSISEPADLPLGNYISRIDLAAAVEGRLQPGRPSESLAAWRDAGGVLQIQRFAADWGALAVIAEGTLALDGQMQPLFAGTAMVRGYSEAIDALVQARMMAPNQATGAKIALAAMTKPADDGGPPAAKLPITIQDGFLFVGPLKLAQMPRIVWQ